MIIQQFIRFAWVGVLGFIVNGGVVAGLSPFSGPLWAQAVGFPLAVTVTWWLNRHFTFSPSRHSLRREWTYYVSANIVGWVVNNGSYVLLVTQSPWFHRHPIAAVAIGSVAGMFFNFTLSRSFVFNHAVSNPSDYPHNPLSFPFRGWSAVALLIVWPLLLKSPLWSGWLISDPLVIYGGLTTDLGGSILPGSSTIDPNIAFTSDALGRRAAQDWLGGTIPWWNPFEGTGTPLVAQIQGGAIFLPFVLLFALNKGQLLFHLCLQIVAGVGSWLLLRRLGMGITAALCGALLFEMNGTYAWLANAVINPIAFLPWLLFGVEEAVAAARTGQGRGWLWIPIALAFSLYAGFPEVAYINGLLVAVWTVVRLFQFRGGKRWRFLFLVGVGVLVGVLLSLPVVVPFIEYIGLAEIGGHESGFGHAYLPRSGLAAIFLPYLYGPIFWSHDPEIHLWWANVGGFFGLGLPFLALLSLSGRHERALKSTIFLWILIGLAKSFGLPGVKEVMNWLPLIEQAAFFRYVWPSLSMGLIVLAGFALDDLVNQNLRGKRLWWGMAMIVLVVVLAAIPAIEPLKRLEADRLSLLAMVGSILVGGAVLATGFGLALAGRSWSAHMIAALVVMEAALFFLIPVLAYPRRGELHVSGVEYLSSHLGLQRFYTTGPLVPNYGSAFGIAQLNYNDLPVPKNLAVYVHDHLDPYVHPILFIGGYHPDPKSPSPLRTLRDNLTEYSLAGVSHIVTRTGEQLYLREYETPVQLSHNVPVRMHGGDTLRVRLELPAGRLSALGIMIGTYRGKSDGMMEGELCHREQCVGIHADANLASDNDFLEFHLAEPLTLHEGIPTEIRMRYENAAYPVAIWLWPGVHGVSQAWWMNGQRLDTRSLRMRFSYLDAHSPPVQIVYQDKVLKIYRQKHYRSYFSAKHCRLQALSRDQVTAHCANPSRLIRLETYYPGWAAMVNGKPALVVETEGLFQQVALPSGESVIHFLYRPSHYGWIMTGFLAGWVLLLSSWWRHTRVLAQSLLYGSR